MKEHLNKHRLEFDPTIKYVWDDLDKTNTLSIELLNIIDFKEGSFFTLLPDNANLQQLYDFKAYGILPQYPEKEYYCEGIKSTYSFIPSIKNTLSHLILDELNSKKNISVVFDDVNSDFTGVKTYDLFVNHGLHLNNEIYYFLNKDNITIELIKRCLKDSNAFWHSLCVFSLTNFHDIKKELELEDLKEICKNTELFMVGAYDSEGYIFWEKGGRKFFE